VQDYEGLAFERHGPILVMRLNRPKKRNAVNGQMHSDLVCAFRELNEDDADVVILTGEGSAFCAGGDISGWTNPSGSNLQRRANEVHDEGRHLVDAILWVEKPLICMLNGPALGLGATLAVLCDFIYAGESATIGDRHVQFAAVAGDGGAAAWPLLIGLAQAKELLMTGRVLSAAEALAVGLVNKVVPDDQLRSVTMEVATELAALEPFAVRATKASINRHLRRAIEDVLDLSIAWERLYLSSDAHHEAAKRFLEKR
jgi:enoyl-CoA hydratase